MLTKKEFIKLNEDGYLKELAMGFLRTKKDGNFYAQDINFALKFDRVRFHPETIWHSDNEDKIYLHGGCNHFEGDIDIESLSVNNQYILACVLKKELD